MKSLLALLVLMIYGEFVAAQQPVFVKKWDKRFGATNSEELLSFSQIKDGGYLLGGYSSSGANGDKTQPSCGGQDFWIVRINSTGHKLWDNRFGGLGNEGVHALKQTVDGGFVLAGPSNSETGCDKTQPHWGGGDYWIVKIDSFGSKEWDKRFGGTLSENLFVIQQTKDSGYIFGGYSNSGISGDKTQDNWDTTYFYDDYWVVKIDSLGNKQWDKRFGGINQDMALSIIQDEDGGYLLGGYSNSGISGDKTQPSWGGSDYWVVKIDALGNKEWDKRYGGTGGDNLHSVIKTFDKGYLLGGHSTSGISGDKTMLGGQWIVKIDAVGNILWDKAFNGGSVFFNSLSQTSDSGYLMACSIIGVSSTDKSEDNLGPCQTWVVKTDSLGSKQWDKTIFTTGCDGYGYAIETMDGCYAVASSVKAGVGGYVTEPNRDGIDSLFDYWLIKFCWEIVNDVNEISGNSKVAVYPNPFTSDLAILVQKENLKQAIFTLSNLQGQIIFKKEENNLASSYTKILDLSYLPGGVYFIEILADGEREVKKVVKE